MVAEPLVVAHGLLARVVAAVEAACGPGAGDADLLSALTFCEGVSRQIERLGVTALAGLIRRGTFAERGYASVPKALTDLVGLDWADARRRAMAAEQAVARVGLDGAVLPARLTATAEVFAAGGCSLRAVEVIARVLARPAARRLSPEMWSAAEERLAAVAGEYSPADLQAWGAALVETLDEDGPEPDDRPPARVNELHLTRHAAGSGGRIRGRFDDPAMFAAIAVAVEAHAAPRTADDQRDTGERQAEALADVCGYVLDHAEVPARGGERPHLSVVVRLEDLENRARAGCLELGGELSPEALRMLCCDARVVPVVLGGAGQPLDVGRATRVIPDGLRRAIAARDRGCARCGRPSSWCEIHHVVPWEAGGPTSLANCCMLCRSCHRLVHHGGWDVHLREGVPEFFPPTWIDPRRSPRGRPRHLAPLPDPTGDTRIRTVRSSPAEASVRPSKLNATPFTLRRDRAWVAPDGILRKRAGVDSHTEAPQALALAMSRMSELNATARNGLLPAEVCTSGLVPHRPAPLAVARERTSQGSTRPARMA